MLKRSVYSDGLLNEGNKKIVDSEAVLRLAAICQSDDEANDPVNAAAAPMIYRAISDQLSGDLGGEAVVLSLKSGKYYGLNTLGARIWELLQAPRSLEVIEAIILSEFEVDADECHVEVTAFIDLLESEGLVENLNGFISEVPAATDNGKGPVS